MSIDYFAVIEAIFYCLIFTTVILLTEAIIDYEKIKGNNPHKSKIKIAILLITTILMTLSIYSTHCYE